MEQVQQLPRNLPMTKQPRERLSQISKTVIFTEMGLHIAWIIMETNRAGPKPR